MSIYRTIKEKSTPKVQKTFYLICATVALMAGLLLFFTPICIYYKTSASLSYGIGGIKISPYNIIKMLTDGFDGKMFNYYIGLAALVLWALYAVVAVFKYVKLLVLMAGKTEKMAQATKGLCVLTTVAAAVCFLGGFCYVFVNVTLGGFNATASNALPLIVSLIVDVAVALYIGIFDKAPVRTKTTPAKKKKLNRLRLEMLVYSTLLLGCTMACFFSKIVKVTFKEESLFPGGPILSNMNFSLSGKNLLKNYAELDKGGQTLAFLLFALLTATVAFYICTLISGLSKSRTFFPLALGTVLVCCVGCFVVGMYGKYYEIMQEANLSLAMAMTQLGSFMEWFGIEDFDTMLKESYTVKSQAFIWFLASIAGASLVLIRRPYSKGTALEREIYGAGSLMGAELGAVDYSAVAAGGAPMGDGAATPFLHDPCPAFSELDALAPAYDEATEEKLYSKFEEPTLPSLVQFVVQYARNSKQHLIYTEEDIAAFIAGLGATKLSILQGMSGTGKTSLPKIFCEALMSDCHIIEVESSWRDKNELLGYYNEFSKMYTPKKFTQALYEARLHPETLHLIVLDEMNLSRIEYYFSDFLSLMEHEPDKREIKLLNVALSRSVKGQTVNYLGLTGGHTIQIPSNVWFVGTANRDESTFEISDKVYDRAHTMNFNKRATRIVHYADPIPPRYLSADALNELLTKAIEEYPFHIYEYPIIDEVEKLLAPYNISFGNRIAKQIEEFVPVYCACFGYSDSVKADAVERILLSKVVSKLELKTVGDKVSLASEFTKLGLGRCSEFILSLDEE